jgi:hypothetical protein
MRSKLLTLSMAVAVAVALVAEFSVAALAYQGNANTSAPARPKAKKRRRPASHAMAMPTTPEGCLNRLATLAAREPLPNYEGEPSKIINEGLLWTDGKAKCPVTDQAQRLKLLELANRWRMNDAAGVRSDLQGMGATASPAAATGGMPRSRRGRRTPAADATPTGDTQAPPPTSGDTQVAPADETSGASNTNTRRARPRRRPSRRNANTANSNS